MLTIAEHDGPPTGQDRLLLEDAIVTSRHAQHAHGEQGPAYGYGAGRRPLWSERDRHAEQLRSQGFVEFADTRDGFVIERADDDEPILLAHTGGARAERADAEQRYAAVLERAGYRLLPDAAGEGEGWCVWPRPGAEGDADERH